MNNVNDQNFDFHENELSSEEQVELYKYWLAIKGNKSMPDRKDFDPMKLPRVLPYIIMNDVFYDPIRFKVRLIGSKCKTPNKFMGKFLNDFPDMKRMTTFLTRGVENKKPYFYFNNAHSEDGIVRLYSSLVLPFSNDDNKINIMMACLNFIDE